LKIARLKVQNYRSLADIEISFQSYYCAVSGKNNSGKTNVLRALRVFFRDQPPYFFVLGFDQKPRISVKEDYPAWALKDTASKSIQIEVDLEISRTSDEGLFQFVVDYIDIKNPPEVLSLRLVTTTPETGELSVVATVNETSIDSRKAQEVLKKLQSSPSILFHNSTGSPEMPIMLSRRVGSLGELKNTERIELEKSKGRLNSTLTKIAKLHQRAVGELLGRLQDKYKVGFSISKFDPDDFPYSLTLGDGSTDIAIENWGSGTQNRTSILMALFRAKRTSEAETSPTRITPIIVIEEPESFLHPSAQGEFGRLIQSLAEEFKVQVIVTTHSHYMLSTDRPECNVLLERNSEKGKLRETTIVDTSGDQWMEPFSLALGLDNEHFKPWKNALFSDSDQILLVEGETDQAYFELLRDESHGNSRFQFDGFIYPYNGRDQVKNRALLGLLKCRYKKFFITYDLDSDKELSKLFEELDLHRGKQFLPIGLNAPGKESIEGLLPDSILKSVYGNHVDLVQQLQSANKENRDSARSKLKKLLLEEFKKVAQPGDEYYGKFYAVAKKIDAAMLAQSRSAESHPATA
jgi:putative ATP-dependent endonuclease of OLD family